MERPGLCNLYCTAHGSVRWTCVTFDEVRTQELRFNHSRSGQHDLKPHHAVLITPLSSGLLSSTPLSSGLLMYICLQCNTQGLKFGKHDPDLDQISNLLTHKAIQLVHLHRSTLARLFSREMNHSYFLNYILSKLS